ncbi:hypothetical protein [Asanoa ishikariensis]|uniref:hypothetical protein n=1 Tax=Asanoa ishikariensis TaxID=137265 RepID=UPI00115FA57B|nr:hypothetical protein [Asanoa ishikariensis]
MLIVQVGEETDQNETSYAGSRHSLQESVDAVDEEVCVEPARSASTPPGYRDRRQGLRFAA